MEAPGLPSAFPAAASGMALTQLWEESQDRQKPRSLSFARCRETGMKESGCRAFSLKTGIHQCNSTV